jgi:hypothetical protein
VPVGLLREYLNWIDGNKFNFDIYIITPKGLILIEEYKENLEYFIFSNFVAINRNN